MVTRPSASRPRPLRLLAAAAAGLVLMFGGTCGVGPTSLSLLAVSGTQGSVPDDARSQVPVPVAAESTAPARRVVRRRHPGRVARRLVRATCARVATLVGVAAQRGPPSRRGPPVLVA